MEHEKLLTDFRTCVGRFQSTLAEVQDQLEEDKAKSTKEVQDFRDELYSFQKKIHSMQLLQACTPNNIFMREYSYLL
jgi:hypothetical protein